MSYDSYDSGGSGSSGGSFDVDPSLKVTPYTMIEMESDRVFGVSTPYGHSLGINLDDVEIIDGALYIDMAADDDEDVTLKLFSWKEATGYSVDEALDRGEEPSAEDAPNVLPKTYGDTQKTYELVGARVMEETDDDGNVILESSSRVRDYNVSDAGEVTFGDFDDLGGEPFNIGGAVMWYGASDYGPTATSQRLASMMTRFGSEAVVTEDGINWLRDTSGDNIIRDDLQGRRLRLIVVRRQSSEAEDRAWNLPILEDVKTGERVTYDNTSEGDSGN